MRSGCSAFRAGPLSYFDPTYLPYMIVACVGAWSSWPRSAVSVVQLLVSIREREANRVPAGDPWDGRSLEWSISAPPPEYNFSLLASGDRPRRLHASRRNSGDAYAWPKQFVDIKMPKNSALGMILCVTGGLIAFGLVWHMWWLVIVAAAAAFAAIIARGFARDTEKIIPASEVRTNSHALAQRRRGKPPDHAGPRS